VCVVSLLSPLVSASSQNWKPCPRVFAPRSEVRWSFLPRQGSHIVAFEPLFYYFTSHVDEPAQHESSIMITGPGRSLETVSHQDAYWDIDLRYPADNNPTTIRFIHPARSLLTSCPRRYNSSAVVKKMGTVMSLHWHHCLHYLHYLHCLQSRNRRDDIPFARQVSSNGATQRIGMSFGMSFGILSALVQVHTCRYKPFIPGSPRVCRLVGCRICLTHHRRSVYSIPGLGRTGISAHRTAP
jgi:hypothetical protein